MEYTGRMIKSYFRLEFEDLVALFSGSFMVLNKGSPVVNPWATFEKLIEIMVDVEKAILKLRLSSRDLEILKFWASDVDKVFCDQYIRLSYNGYKTRKTRLVKRILRKLNKKL